VLGFGGSNDSAKAQAAYAALYRRMQDAGGSDVELKIANRLWPHKRFAFLAAFVNDAKKLYDAAPEPLDFSADLEGSRRAINHWVEEQTADRIKELIKPGVLPNDTRLILTNAIYFKGAWTDKFNKAATADAPFHLAPDKQVDVPMMHRAGGYRYAEDEAAQWIELPYANGGMAMVVALPRRIDGLADVAKRLDAATLAQRVAGMAHRESVKVWLPRFKMTAAFELSDVLSAIGMPLAFDEHKADFSGMSSAEALMISKVLHQAYVDVNEEGTEAAAATGVVMKPKMARPPTAPVEFRADRPFLFVIRDTGSGAILFMGRVSNPSA
jgi:serpin B